MRFPSAITFPYLSLLILLLSLRIAAQERGYLLPYNTLQWQYYNSGAYGVLDADINLPDAWKLTTGGYTANNDEIVIAIVDRGVNLRHPGLAGNIWTNHNEVEGNGIDDDHNGHAEDIHGWNYCSNTNDVGNNGRGSWHGSPINGIIGANGIDGVWGINQQIKLMNLVRGDDTSSIFRSYDYIYNMRKAYNESGGRRGAFIVAVNNSWGLDSLLTQGKENWCYWYDKLGEVGILSVVAAPNENIDIDRSGDMPSACISNFILSTTNTNHHDRKVLHAGYGANTVHIAAPGNHSYTTLNNGGYGYFGGTSAAAAYISGTIGLLYSIPSLSLATYSLDSPSDAALIIKRALMEGAEKLPSLASITISEGRLNVYKSMLWLCNYYNEHELTSVLRRGNSIAAVYPNPTSNDLIIAVEISDPTMVSYAIYSSNGRVVKKCIPLHYPEGIHFISVTSSPFCAGLYHVRVLLNNHSESFTFIKR